MHFIRRILVSFFGNFQWQPPAWLPALGRLAWRRRRTTALILAAIVAVAGGGMWVRHLPKPVTVKAIVLPPGIAYVGEDKLYPSSLEISFDASVGPLFQNARTIERGITMEPAAAGRWFWKNDSTLRFDPVNDWPAATKYRVTLDRSVVASHIRLASYRYDWKTPDFTASVRKIEFYQDPRDPSVKQLVATVDLSHQADAESFASHAGFFMLGRRTKEPCDVSYDKFHRVAYLRSKPIILPELEDYAKLTLSKGIRTVQGGATTASDVEDKCRVPDIYSFFRIADSGACIVRNSDGEPEQVLTISTTCAIKSAELARSLSIRLLPKKKPTREDPHAKWDGPREITADVLANSREVTFETIPSRDPVATEHAFRFRVPENGQLFIRVAEGLRAPGDFVLGKTYDNIATVPIPEPSVAFEGEGAVLALSGERKISVKSRNVPAIEYSIARVATSQINHLVSQTRGDFGSPQFRSYCFDEENISRLATERQLLEDRGPFVENFSTFDFAPHLAIPADGGTERGLFFLTARGWDPKTKKPVGDDDDSNYASDSRFLLVTDLGLIVKENADGSRDLFVASIKTGRPLAGVQACILGKNGEPVAQEATDADGHARFDSVGKDEHERQPVAFVARLGDDVAFLPYDRGDRRLDFSRFDTGGDEARSGAELNAFLFTERGMYRPGDTIHIGYIVKRRDWAAPPAGLPLEMEVVDARDKAVLVKRIAIPADGFGEFEYATMPASPTGFYTINLYLVRDRERAGLLASTSLQVKEFLPDRMKIAAQLNKSSAGGWISPDDVKAFVSLQNLYGSPAAGRRVTARLNLSPGSFAFDAWPGYQFDDPLWREWTSNDLRSITLPDQTTDDKGAATVALDLERFANPTYAMTLSIEGFEGGGGRSVGTQQCVLVSPLDHVVGYKPDGDLSYIPVGTKRAVNFVAINGALKPVRIDGLRFHLIERKFVSVLKRQENGNYAYESVEQDNDVSDDTRVLPETGFEIGLATSRPGSFKLELREAGGTKVSEFFYTVVGKGDASRSVERNAELEIKLPRREYRAGEEVEIAITAPYTGGGLITLERDRVYAQSWFAASTTSSVQKIRIPADFEGTGYINVAFVRALDSKEVFMSPLSYAVEPIVVNREQRRLGIQLDVAEKAKPGEPLVIRYRADRPSRIVIYAVDEGILQVDGYRLPQPLDYFFRKTALMVGTSQIVDLILPEFSILRSASAAGGDADMLAKNLNPFRRVTEKPVVYWSGIVDAGPDERTVTYDVPDYFDGTLKVMAVAYATSAVCSAERKTLVRSRYVITPAVPTVVAPGDVFDVGVTVNNGGAAADVALTAAASEQLEILKAPAMPLKLDAGMETTCLFSVRAKDKLGSASLEFRASGGGEESRRHATMSVRPAVPYRTQVSSAHFTSARFDMPLNGGLRPEFRKLEATLSALPLGLARGLQSYLDEYPYGCSEQISSGALCRLVLAGEVDFGLSRAAASDQLEHAFGILRQRQNDQGAFGYWGAGASDGIDFISVYVTQLLVEAKAAGFVPPSDMLASALRNLSRMAGEQTPRSLEQARIQAWAIYLLTREETVTTNAIINLRDTLDHDYPQAWRADLTAVYLAGALELLKQDGEARKLIAGYRCGRGCDGSFYDGLVADAQYIAVLARQFPDLLKRLPEGEFEKVLEPIQAGHFNTLSAACAVIALKSYSSLVSQSGVQLGLSELLQDNKSRELAGTGTLLKRADFSPDATALRFAAGATPMGVFCQAVESGFDAKLPFEASMHGLEIYREFPRWARVGEPITVKVFVRAIGASVPNAAIVDLLPGGFEVVGYSLQPGAGTLPGWDFVEVREDRVVIFGEVNSGVREINYQVKATSAGRFAIPPAFAESMYDRGTNARSAAGWVDVSAR